MVHGRGRGDSQEAAVGTSIPPANQAARERPQGRVEGKHAGVEFVAADRARSVQGRTKGTVGEESDTE